MNTSLDNHDLAELKKLIERSCHGGGFFCVIGPRDLFDPAISELQKGYADRGITDGVETNLESINVDDIEAFAQQPPPVLYIKGFDNENAWERIKIRRDNFLLRNSKIIFFLLPFQYREFAEKYSSIFSNTLDTQYSLGGQRTMDDMGDPFLNRLRKLLPEIDGYEARLDEAVNYTKTNRPDHLVVLRRWNSFSPILSHRPPQVSPDTDTREIVKQVEGSIWRQLRREIRGGGYFFSWRKFGIAVDPGHNFIENLYSTGYSVRDIDSVVITHDHLDHHADFEAVVDLLYQCRKRGQEKKISVFLNPTTYKKYHSLLNSNPDITRVVELKLEGPKYHLISKTPRIRLHSLRANHTELNGKREAASLLFRLHDDQTNSELRIGFTADTGWHPKMKDFFSGVDVLVAHIGSVKRHELEEASFYGNHLGILGLFKILQDIYDPTGSRKLPTVILSEFGEELLGLRDILGKELCDRFEKMRVFPADIGHTVELKTGDIKILCGQEKCIDRAQHFFEHNGEIALRCARHRPALADIDPPDR